MRKNVLIFGTTSGLILAVWLIVTMLFFHENMDMNLGMVLGYTSMIISNIFLVIGVKNYRDKYNNGVISFGKAFKVGILIALIASTFYVATWLIYSYTAGFNFTEFYTEAIIKEMKDGGASVTKIAQTVKEMKEFAVSYQNPFVRAMYTYMEILPIGLLFSVVTAIIMRRKTPKNTVVDN